MGQFFQGVFVVLLIPALVFLTQQTFADEDVDTALIEVQKQLQNPAFIEQEAKKSSQAQQSKKMVSDIAGGSENEKEIYALAAEVLGNFKGMTIEQMQQELLRAQSNPDHFAKKWTPEQKKRLEAISKKLPAAAPTQKP